MHAEWGKTLSPGLGRAGLDRPSAELSIPFVCVCVIYEEAAPPHTYTHTAA